MGFPAYFSDWLFSGGGWGALGVLFIKLTWLENLVQKGDQNGGGFSLSLKKSCQLGTFLCMGSRYSLVFTVQVLYAKKAG